MLSLQKLNAGYGKLRVLHDVNFHANKNEIIAVIGPNGAGKSTIIKSLYGLADIYSGEILFRGKDITKLKLHELIDLGIAYMPQGKIVFDTMSVQENLELGCVHVKDASIVKRRMASVYTQFPVLKEKKDSKAFTLSGDQKQMLALGRVLMQKPKLLLMDEPSLGLSPKLQKKLFQIITHLKKRGITIIVVEQNAKKAIEIADRTYLLENGKVVLTGGKEILQAEKIKTVYLGNHSKQKGE